jgi:dihydropteroate synthase type 1
MSSGAARIIATNCDLFTSRCPKAVVVADTVARCLRKRHKVGLDSVRNRAAKEAADVARIAGILNITEDSFSDGGRFLAPGDALARAHAIFAEGADLIDIGPAASNPDAAPVGEAEEIARIAPVLDTLADRLDSVSIDSFLPGTQRYAMARGVGYLNDIQGFPDPALYGELAASRCRLIVMHSVQGRGRANRTNSLAPAEAVDRIIGFFEARLSALEAAGIDRSRFILDPGMGFFLSPDPETSFRVLAELPRLKAAFGLPVLVSVSRKSFLRAVTGRPAPEAGPASLAAELFAAERGADYIRTHAPGALHDALLVRAALAGQPSRRPPNS